MVRTRTESLTWGLLVLLLGILLQVHFLRPELEILDNLWKFWPVLLIVMGLNKLIRFFTAGSSPGSDPPR